MSAHMIRHLIRHLIRSRRGVAMTEFAMVLPVFIFFAMSGVELTNYVTTRMRISQTALHLADHAARMGAGSLLAAKTISETQVNDVLTGAGLQAGDLDLYTQGRVIISSLEPVATPNTTNRFKIGWQRCRGMQNHASSYGVAGATNLTGIGPPNQRVTAPAGGATMFVEVYYRYRPIIAGDYAPRLEMTETASMMVRDRRDLTRIYNSENATVSACNRFTTS